MIFCIADAVSLLISNSDPQIQGSDISKVVTFLVIFAFLNYSSAVSSLLNLTKACVIQPQAFWRVFIIYSGEPEATLNNKIKKPFVLRVL